MKNLINKYFSETIQVVIYGFFSCMTLVHMFGSQENISSSVSYFVITNTITLALSLLLAYRYSTTKLSEQAKDALLFYSIYLVSFISFFAIVGLIAKDIDDYFLITSSCIGAVFYFITLLFIAIAKIVSHGFRKSR